MAKLAEKARAIELIEPTMQGLATGFADVDELGRERGLAGRRLALELSEQIHARECEPQA